VVKHWLSSKLQYSLAIRLWHYCSLRNHDNST